jgi:hypothetical protein
MGSAEPLDLFVTTAEDTILAKLDWFRKGGEISDRQWRDVPGVMKVQADALDRAYLREWAARLNVDPTDQFRPRLSQLADVAFDRFVGTVEVHPA